jgi:ABC-type molybdate transport system ATPase subunit
VGAASHPGRPASFSRERLGKLTLLCCPARVVAVITRDAAEELGLRPGWEATAVVKATSVMIEL